MFKVSSIKPSLKWNTAEIRRQHSRGVSSGYYITSTPTLKAFRFSREANQKNRLRENTTPISQVSLTLIFERLKELAQLEADWDSYGAKAISSVALVTAFEVLEGVKERLSTKVKEPLPQFIAPLADGGLQLEWSRKQGDIEVEIYPDGDLGYVLIEGQGTTRKFQEKHQVSLDEVLNLLSQFLSLELEE
jgi:hypothetical protein